MKKLLIPFIVLWMAGFLNAGTVDLVISGLNGQPITPRKEIDLMMGDTVTIDVVYDGPQGWSVWSLSKELISEGSMGETGSLDISSITWPAGYWYRDLSKITATTKGALIDTIASDIGTVPPGVILDHFQFKYFSGGSEYLSLVERQNTGAGQSLETEGTDLFPIETGPGVTINHTHVQLNCWYYCPGQPYGDTNGDGKINATDYFNFKKSYGTNVGNPHGTGVGEYNCCCDFSGDYKVDATDYFIFKKNYGKSGLGTCSTLTCQ